MCDKDLISRAALWKQFDKAHLFDDGNPRHIAQQLVEEAPAVNAVILPHVKIGDTAFFIIDGNIFEGNVCFIRWEHHERFGIHTEITASLSPYTSVGASLDDFGKTVFLTREEAEAALAELMEAEGKDGIKQKNKGNKL